jgi:hypothetical protein
VYGYRENEDNIGKAYTLQCHRGDKFSWNCMFLKEVHQNIQWDVHANDKMYKGAVFPVEQIGLGEFLVTEVEDYRGTCVDNT